MPQVQNDRKRGAWRSNPAGIVTRPVGATFAHAQADHRTRAVFTACRPSHWEHRQNWPGV